MKPIFDHSLDADNYRKLISEAPIVDADDNFRQVLDLLCESVEEDSDEKLMPDMLWNGFWYRPRRGRGTTSILICELVSPVPEGFTLLPHGMVRLPDGTEKRTRFQYFLDKSMTVQEYYLLPKN